jgi:hypothetical protein
MWWNLLMVSAFATPEEEVAAAVSRCGGAVYPLPALTADHRARLVRGDVVKIVQHAADPDAPSRAVGLALLRGGRDALWVAAQDLHATVDPSLTEFVIERLGPDHALWYGHLDLPSPITDRQWVVDSKNSHGLAAGGCWEHHWSLVADGLDRARTSVVAGQGKVTVAQLDEAIFTPVNHGNWLMVELPDGRTLVAYSATSVVGGSIPAWLVLKLTMARLESVLRGVETRAESWSPAHYVAGHDPLYGGDGAPIPPLGSRETR